VLALVIAASAAVGSPAAAQSPLQRIAGLTLHDESLEVALRLLQRTADVSLVYSPDLLPAGQLVACACVDATVGEALETMLSGTGLTFTASRTLIRIVPMRDGDRATRTGVVEGLVLDAQTGLPIVNAMVRVVNGGGTLSSANGAFVLEGLPPGTHHLEVTSIGWRSSAVEVRLEAGDTASVTIRLERHIIPLPAMVVTPGAFGLLEDVSPGTVTTLSREEMATMPQLGEDVLRAVKRIPGVASDDISTRLNVRGGYDRDLLIRLDGLELYEPYHLKDWNGVFGIVDVHALGGVQLSSGGFGAEYGDKTAGVLDMSSRGSVEDTKTTLGLSISSVTAMSRGAFDGERGGWLVSARRGFLDLVLDLIDENQAFSPQYYDVFGKLDFQLTPRDLLTAHVLQAGDDFVYRDQPEPGIEEADVATSWDSSYGWLTWKATRGRGLTSTTVLSTGRVTRNRAGWVLDRNDAPDSIDTQDHRDFTFVGVRNDLAFEISDDLLLKLGGEAKRISADYDFANRIRWAQLTSDSVIEPRYDSMALDLEPDGHEVAAYAALRARPVERLTAEVGLRYDRISHTDDRDVSPRLLAAADLSPRTTLRASWGRYRQSHGIHELEVGDGQTTYHPAERTDQLAIGLEHVFASGITARLELYRRWLVDLRPVFFNMEQELKVFPEATLDRAVIDPDEGRAHGAELLVERKSGRRWAWSASYALAVAEDRVNASWTPRPFDQRHTLGLHVSYTPAPQWNLSLGWRFHSGWPATAWTWQVVPLPDGSYAWLRIFGTLRGERVPPYHRLDFRVTREFRIGGNVLEAFVDVFNVYDRTNLGSYGYQGNYSNGRLTVARVNGQEQLPRLPTFGLRWEF
jgi:hypothetical protein